LCRRPVVACTRSAPCSHPSAAYLVVSCRGTNARQTTTPLAQRQRVGRRLRAGTGRERCLRRWALANALGGRSFRSCLRCWSSRRARIEEGTPAILVARARAPLRPGSASILLPFSPAVPSLCAAKRAEGRRGASRATVIGASLRSKILAMTRASSSAPPTVKSFCDVSTRPSSDGRPAGGIEAAIATQPGAPPRATSGRPKSGMPAKPLAPAVEPTGGRSLRAGPPRTDTSYKPIVADPKDVLRSRPTLLPSKSAATAALAVSWLATSRWATSESHATGSPSGDALASRAITAPLA